MLAAPSQPPGRGCVTSDSGGVASGWILSVVIIKGILSMFYFHIGPTTTPRQYAFLYFVPSQSEPTFCATAILPGFLLT